MELAVVFLLKVLRKGDHNRLADIKQHVATGEDFFVRSRNIVYPAEALRIALSQYEEEVRTSKPATLPAAPAASSPAAEEVADPPQANGSVWRCRARVHFKVTFLTPKVRLDQVR